MSEIINPNNNETFSPLELPKPRAVVIGGTQLEFYPSPHAVVTVRPETLSNPEMMLGFMSGTTNTQHAIMRELVALREQNAKIQAELDELRGEAPTVEEKADEG